MKRTLSALTTIVIAAGLAITGVSTASADDAVTPPPTTVAPAAGPAATDVTPPAPSASTPAPATKTSLAASAPAKSTTPNPSASPIPSNDTCLPSSAVRYSYDPTKNSGIVTVTAQPYSTAQLCAPIFITAASWKYTKAALWPQVLDSSKTNYVTVNKVGTYTFGAPVTCGQGDIYARTGSYIVPTATLSGPQSWEKFLSGLGLQTTYPGNTYTQTPVGCVQSLPLATAIVGQCYWNAELGDSLKTVTIKYDNRQSNVPVDFSIQGDATSPRTVGGGDSVEVVVSPSGVAGANYTVIAGGSNTKLLVPAFEACPPNIPTLPLVEPTPVTFVDTCGTTGDKVVIPAITSDDHFTYSTTSDTTSESGVRTVTVTAAPDSGYGIGSDTVTSWTHTFKTDAQNNCVTIPGDPEAVGQTCAVSSDGVVSGYLTVSPVTGVVYTIHPVTPTGADITVTAVKTNVAPGDYLITAAAKPGFILSGVTEWQRTVENNAVECTLPTDAFLPSSVSWVGQTCSAGGTVSGYIAIDPTDFLSYFVGTTQLVSARTAFAPGTYVVTVTAPAGDTIDGPSSYTATITKASTSCGNLDPQSLTTLAFTGFDGGAGYLAVASAFLVLGTALVFGARRKAKA